MYKKNDVVVVDMPNTFNKGSHKRVCKVAGLSRSGNYVELVSAEGYYLKTVDVLRVLRFANDAEKAVHSFR